MPRALSVPQEIRTSLEERLAANSERTPAGCLEWTGLRHEEGYGRVYVAGRVERAHRLAWVLAHGPLLSGERVLHSCDNPPCMDAAHLFKGTQADNLADMTRKGRRRGGGAARTLNGRAKLSESQVALVRVALSERERQVDIAERFGVTQTTVSRIARGDGWIEGEPC